MHWLSLTVISVIAVAIAMYLLIRIGDVQQKLAALQDDLHRNDLKLQDQLARLDKSESSSIIENSAVSAQSIQPLSKEIEKDDSISEEQNLEQ